MNDFEKTFKKKKKDDEQCQAQGLTFRKITKRKETACWLVSRSKMKAESSLITLEKYISQGRETMWKKRVGAKPNSFKYATSLYSININRRFMLEMRMFMTVTE